jgi:DNA-binding response OmpR family regulator
VKIGLLEDDQHVGELIRLWIEEAGHECALFESGEEFKQNLQDNDYDILILDWILPDTSGDVVLSWIRQNKGWEIPIIFVTQRDSEEDIVAALQQGADDYMTKPVKQGELVARISALGRRVKAGNNHGSNTLYFEPYKMDMSSHTLLRGDDVISLTQKEFDLAVYLFSNAGRIISRAKMLETVWGSSPDLNTRTVDIHISRLRKKLALNGEHGWKLAGIYNHGYRLERVHSVS